MMLGTTYVLGKEPALNLAEVNLMAPTGNNGTTAWFRFQIIVVWRNDAPYEYRRRLGLAKDFKANQFRIMGGVLEGNEVFIEETVERLKEMADQMRDEKPIDLFDLAMSRRN